MSDIRYHLVRFWSKVDQPATGCWNWTGGTNHAGYGFFYAGGRRHRAHRVAYRSAHGAIPDGMEVDHTCANRRCCRPSHLQVVTPERNKQLVGERRTHCPHGHPYNEENTIRRADGGRDCRECTRRRTREYQRKVRAGVAS